MLCDMWGAIAFSTGNKAKARDKQGDVVIVERHYSRIQYAYVLHVITRQGDGSSNGFDGRLGELKDALLDSHGLNMSATCWLPVETPFPDEASE